MSLLSVQTCKLLPQNCDTSLLICTVFVVDEKHMVEEIEAVELTGVAAGAAAGGAPTQTDQARVIELEGENNDLRRSLADLVRRHAALEETLEQTQVNRAHLKKYRSCCIFCCGLFFVVLVALVVMGMMGLHLLCPTIQTWWRMSECNETLGVALGLAQERVHSPKG